MDKEKSQKAVSWLCIGICIMLAFYCLFTANELYQKNLVGKAVDAPLNEAQPEEGKTNG